MSKSKRFRFNNESDELLARVVVQLGAHNPNHGETEEKFAEVRKTFCESHVFRSIHEKFGAPEPKTATLRNRWTSIIEKRRAANKADIGKSGIERDYTEHQVLLDNAIEDIDTKKQISQETKNAKEVYLKDVVAAGSDIRAFALKSFIDTPDGEVESSPTPRRAKRTFENTFDGEFELVKEDSKRRREHQDKKLALAERRLVLEEKRYEMEREDRRLAQEAVKANTELMKALVAQMNK